MSVFLDDYLEDKKDCPESELSSLQHRFVEALTLLGESVGDKVFRPQNALNAAVFDAIMVGCALRLDRGGIKNKKSVQSTYESLLKDEDFKRCYERATADDESVKNRMRLSIDAFAAIR
jgi:hypothetical protein